MAKITLDLNKFKASGIYTVEFDASERIVLSTETIRLVVGFSRKGPFNVPVFIRDIKTARKIFGKIDTFLEKRNSFFHRSIETCLQTGPVFALNLLPLNNVPISEGGDAVEYRSFSLDISDENGSITKSLYSSFYNKERFWFPDTKNFISIVNNNPLNKGRLLNLVNLSQTPMSFIIRKPNPKVNGYAVTAREWYGMGNVPEYIYEFDFIEDYFLELIAIEGDWTNYKVLSEDPVYSKYFDKRGIKVDKLNEFLALEEVTMVAKFVGSIIPDFVDKQGRNQYLETLVNNAVATTGIFLSINRDAIEDYSNSLHKIDLVGHNLINTSDDVIDFLSYNTPISKALKYDNMNIYEHNTTPLFNTTEYPAGGYDNWYIISNPIGGNSGLFANVLVIPKPSPTQQVFNVNKYQEILNNLKNISLIKTKGTIYGKDFVKVEEVIDNGNEFRVILSNPEINNATYFVDGGIFDSIDVTQNKIVVENTPSGVTTQTNLILFIEAPGYKHYFEAVFDDSNNTYTILIPPNNITSDHNPFEYVSGNEALIELKEALDNGIFFKEDIKLTVWDNYQDQANNEFVVDLLTSVGGGEGISIVYEPDVVFIHKNLNAAADYLEAYPGAKLSKDIVNNRLVDGDIVYYTGNAWYYINVDEQWGEMYDNTSNLKYGLIGTRLREYENQDLTLQVIGSNFVGGGSFGTNYSHESGNSNIYGNGNDLIFYSASIEDLKVNVPIISGSINAIGNTFKIKEEYGNKIEIGYFLVNSNEEKLTRVISKVKIFNQLTGEIEYEIKTTTSVKLINIGNTDNVIIYTPLNKYIDRLQFTYLKGFKLTEYHLPGTQEQLNKIYGVIENTNLGITLANKDIISFRYIIDTMGFGIAPQMGPKSILSRLAKKRGKCMVIANAPSIKEFMESTDPRFTDEPDPNSGNPRPVLNTEYIASGGNLSLGPSFKFSLPDEENGAKYFSVFAPWFILRENNKNIIVPPAADVSNNFIRKFLNGQPYSIVAGPRRGVISNPKLVGLEYEFTLQDRENLEPFGINPIVTIRM